MFLLVDPERPHVTVDRRRQYGGFDAESYNSMDQVIPLFELGAELRMRDVYAGLDV